MSYLTQFIFLLFITGLIIVSQAHADLETQRNFPVWKSDELPPAPKGYDDPTPVPSDKVDEL